MFLRKGEPSAKAQGGATLQPGTLGFLEKRARGAREGGLGGWGAVSAPTDVCGGTLARSCDLSNPLPMSCTGAQAGCWLLGPRPPQARGGWVQGPPFHTAHQLLSVDLVTQVLGVLCDPTARCQSGGHLLASDKGGGLPAPPSSSTTVPGRCDCHSRAPPQAWHPWSPGLTSPEAFSWRIKQEGPETRL